MSAKPVNAAFHECDEIVLAEGTYQGTVGVFLRLRQDIKWEDITERNGTVRRHPVAWLAHSAERRTSSGDRTPVGSHSTEAEAE